MEHTDLGPLRVSRVGLGCNNFGGRLDLAATRRVVDAALDAGVNFFDTADIYGNRGGSERLLGELLQGRRDRVVLATKFGGEMGDGAVGGAPAYVVRAVEASLQRLQTDHVDLLYHHFPDDATPIADTVGAMSELVGAGKVRAIGVSNVTADRWRRRPPPQRSPRCRTSTPCSRGRRSASCCPPAWSSGSGSCRTSRSHRAF